MREILKDKTHIVEILSSVSFFLMAFGLIFSGLQLPDSRSIYFWAIIFLILSGLQFVSLLFRKELWIVRICTAWFAGTTWIVLSCTVVNSVMMIPVMMIGITNLYAFTMLTGAIKIDWSSFQRTEKDHADSIT